MFQIDVAPEHLRPLQIIHGALAGGVCTLALVALFIPGPAIPSQGGGEDVVTILSMIHAIAFFTALGVGRFMFDSQTRREKLDALVQDSSPETSASLLLGLIRRVYIIRLALLEAAAFLGIAVILVAKMIGVLEAAPVYWLNLLSAVFFLGFIAFTFPTREKIADILR